MRRPTLVLLAYAALVAPLPAQAGTPKGLDWARAVADFSRGGRLEPGGMTWRTEELDGDGAVRSWEEVRAAFVRSGGETRAEVLSARKDGKDVTDAWRKRFAGEGGGGAGGGPDFGEAFRATPFDPGFQAGLAVSPSSPVLEGGVRLLRTPYALDAGKGRALGAVVSDASGEPLYATQTWDRLPFAVSRLDARIRFGRGPAGELVVRTLEYDAELTVLLVRKRYRFSIGFSDWRAAPQSSRNDSGSRVKGTGARLPAPA